MSSPQGAAPPQHAINELLDLFNRGQLDEVRSRAGALLRQYPASVMLWNLLGASSAQYGQLDAAEQAFRKATELAPRQPLLFNNLGNVLQQLGRSGEAIECYGKAIQLKPDYADAHYNKGLALSELEKLDDAAASYRQALKLRPEYPEALLNLGNVLKQQNRAEEAVECYNRALRIRPNLADAHNNLGNVQQDMGRLDDAVASYNRALMLNPAFAEAHMNLGNALQEQGKLDQAVSSYNRALSHDAGLAPCWGSLIELHERSNDLAAAADVLDRARAQFGDGLPVELKIANATLRLRNDDHRGCLDVLAHLDPGQLSGALYDKYFELKGKSHEVLADYAAAFACFEEQNAYARSQNTRLEGPAHAYATNVSARAEALEAASCEADPARAGEGDHAAPVFLVGFPRSGTTLLDTLMRGHPHIAVVEEEPMLDRATAVIGEFRSLAAIEALTGEQRSAMRAAYEAELRRHLPEDGRAMIIDKLPLNIVRVPEILAMYPDAKFILVLRHPLDCVLSNFKQSFKMNEPMYLMTALQSACGLYDAIMRIFFASARRYGFSWHSIRYEDLIADTEREARSLIEFLGLEWNGAVLDHQATARKRQRINTPSYSQVIKPIYKTSSQLWKRYEAQLEPYRQPLEPWIARFGYGAEED